METGEKTTNLTDFTGNLIPHSWYRSIVSKSGRPDHSAMSILSEIVYWYRPRKIKSEEGTTSYARKFKGDMWQTSYAFFEKKFSYGRQKIRRALVRLEELGLIKRNFLDVTTLGQKYNSRLFIFLDPERLKKLSGENYFFSEKNVPPGLQNEAPLDIREKNIFKNRSIPEAVETSRAPAERRAGIKKKPLGEFAPVSEAEAEKLATESGKAFSLSFVNSLKSKLEKRLQAPSFFSRKSMLSYLAICLKNEKRDPKKVSFPGYRMESREEYSLGKYLESVEYDRSGTALSAFKRRIASGFSPKIAAEVLGRVSGGRNGGAPEIDTEGLADRVKETLRELAEEIYGPAAPREGYKALGGVWGEIAGELRYSNGEGAYLSCFSRIRGREGESGASRTLSLYGDGPALREAVSKYVWDIERVAEKFGFGAVAFWER